MPLAGRMRLNTFLALLAAATATCGAGGLIFGSIFWPEPECPDMAERERLLLLHKCR